MCGPGLRLDPYLNGEKVQPSYSKKNEKQSKRRKKLGGECGPGGTVDAKMHISLDHSECILSKAHFKLWLKQN